MRHDFDDGKYTVIFDETSGRMSALRYGDEWRDLCGDKLIYSMLSAYDSTSLEVAQLQARVAELEAALRGVTGALDQMGDQPDRLVCPEVWRRLNCEELVTLGKEALGVE